MASIDRSKSKKKPEDAQEKIKSIIDSVNTRVLDMADVVNGIWLAILAGGVLQDGRLVGEHLFMIGGPGVGKTYVMDLIRQCMDLTEEEYFDVLMNSFTTPDDIIGPTDTKLFMEKHISRRNLIGYIAQCLFAVLDEIWKSGPVTTSIFKITNERVYRNGDTIVKCPLITMLSASNEYPQNPMDAPLWDRILFRYFVRAVEGKENWKKIDKIKHTPWNPPKITIPEIMAAKKEVNLVAIPDDVEDAIIDVHVALAKMGIELSPRRRIKMWDVVRASAFLQGRSKATVPDVSAIWPACWRHDKEIPQVKRLIAKVTNFEMDKIMTKVDLVFKLYEEAKPLVTEYEKTQRYASLGNIDELEEKIAELKDELEKMSDKINSINVAEHAKALSQVSTWHRELLPFAIARNENPD